MGVVGFDWRLGGGVSSVISERAGRRSAQLRIYVFTSMKGLTASGVGCQIHLNFVQQICFVDVRFIDRLGSFLQRNMNMAAMSWVHGWLLIDEMPSGAVEPCLVEFAPQQMSFCFSLWECSAKHAPHRFLRVSSWWSEGACVRVWRNW